MCRLNDAVLKKLSDRALSECGLDNTKSTQNLSVFTVYKHKLPNNRAWITADIQPYIPH